MKIVCPHCRSDKVKITPSGTRARCLSCLYSWLVVAA
jgi:predicted Zn finger-like uncharacterized protein